MMKKQTSRPGVPHDENMDEKHRLLSTVHETLQPHYLIDYRAEKIDKRKIKQGARGLTNSCLVS